MSGDQEGHSFPTSFNFHDSAFYHLSVFFVLLVLIHYLTNYFCHHSRLFPLGDFYTIDVATLGSILDSHSENLASFSLQDGATEWHYFLVWTPTPHPPNPHS